MSGASAQRQAEQLVVSLGYSLPPIDVEQVARTLGLPVTKEELGEDVSGLLITNNGAHICVQARDPPNRRRFTIAHEIGHYYLKHQFEPGEYVHVDRGNFISRRGPRASEGIDPREVEANQFAASLLMPCGLVDTAIEALGVSVLFDQHVLSLVKLFKVSEQAMTIRLDCLNLL